MGALAPGNGVRQRHDLLATTVRLAPGWRLGHDPPRLARSPRRNRPDRLGAGLAGCSECTRAKGGQKTGPNPTDRGKTGSKRHLIVDGRGTPLAIRHTAANRHETTMVEELVDAVPAIRWPRGRPRRRPGKLRADKAYDSQANRTHLRKRGILSRIARRGRESSQRLGRHRWVVERTLAWLNRFRRLKVRYERRDDIHQAFLTIGCVLLTWRAVERFC